MDEPTDTTRNTPLHRQFKLTPLPGATRDEAGPKGGRWKSGRRLLIGGSAVAPVILTMRSRSAFAQGICTASLAMSQPSSGETTSTNAARCGNNVTYWQQAYPILQEDSQSSGVTKLPAQVTGINYLSNNTYVAGTSGTIFTFPSALNGVSFSANPSGNFDLAAALAGGVTFVVSVTLSSGPNPGTATANDAGGTNGLFAQAAAAVLNAATFGSTAFGYTDMGLIAQVNGVFATMQANALTYESANPNAQPQDVANYLITGAGGFTSEISTLNTLNSQSNG